MRNCLIAHAADPFFFCLLELKVDFWWIVRHPRNLVPVEVALNRTPFLDSDFLPHCITQRPGNLAFDLLADRERVNEREALVEHNIDALEAQLSTPRDRHSHHVGAYSNH